MYAHMCVCAHTQKTRQKNAKANNNENNFKIKNLFKVRKILLLSASVSAPPSLGASHILSKSATFIPDRSQYLCCLETHSAVQTGHKLCFFCLSLQSRGDYRYVPLIFISKLFKRNIFPDSNYLHLF